MDGALLKVRRMHEAKAIANLQRSQRNLWWMFLALAMWNVATFVFGQVTTLETEAIVAHADRQQFPASDWPYLRYVTSYSLPANLQPEAHTALSYWANSLSGQRLIVKPAVVSPTLFRRRS